MPEAYLRPERSPMMRLRLTIHVDLVHRPVSPLNGESLGSVTIMVESMQAINVMMYASGSAQLSAMDKLCITH